MKSERVYWIDALRAIAIVFVVIGHTPGVQGYGNIVKYLFSFHIPLFFFISGLLFNSNLVKVTFPQFLHKQVRALLIPYLIWGLLTYIPWLLITRHFSTYPDLNPLKPLLGMLYGVGGGTWLIHNGALWFLPCLFFTRLIFLGTLRNETRSFFPLVLLILTVLGILCVELITVPIPWGFDIALLAMSFFGTGYLLRDRLRSFQIPPTQYILGILGGLFLLHIIIVLTNERVSMGDRTVGNGFLFEIGAFLGIMFWFLISKIIPKSSFISLLGENTMMIFILHTFAFNLITGFAVFILKLPPTFKYESLIVSVIYTLIAIVFIIPFIAIVRRFQPWMIGR